MKDLILELKELRDNLNMPTCECCIGASKRIHELIKKYDWKSIDEPPKESGYYLVNIYDKEKHESSVARDFYQEGCTQEWSHEDITTDWMYLPLPKLYDKD